MRSLVRPRFGAVIGAALLALVLAHPNHALAGTATVNGSVLGYTALPGETNDVSVEHWNAGLPDDFWVLNDYGAPVVPGPGCEPFAFGLAGHSVDCGTPSSVNADLADLDDRFRVQDLRAVVLGGAGDDALHASALADSLDGGAGNDSLYAGRGSDDVEGGPGDDTIDAEACNGSSCGPDGTDSYAGGDGVDTISFGHRHAAVWVSLNDVADDGEPGELDNIASDIENATGGEGGDTIVGNDGPNVLDGGADYGGGPNTIQGLGGNDLLRGGMGCCDDLEGGAGDDALFAGMSGGGVLDGGGGDDTMIPSFLGVPPPVNVIGGDGVDTADFSGSFGSVSISLDDVANDGTGSDNVHADVENVTAGGGNDTLVGNSADNVLDGGPGTDSVQGGAGTDTVSYASRGVAVTVTLDGIADDGDQASQENDNIGVDVENVAGGSGPDKLVGNAGANVLNGGPGDDVLDGALGADVMRGGDGAHDAATYASRTTAVNVSVDGAANDGVVGEDDNVGTDVEDLVGGSANDTLTGNEADNLLDGGPGGDDMSGGGGVDGVSYASRSASVTVSLDGAANDGAAGEGDHVATDVENVVGGLGNDELVGNAGPNTLDGGDGNDLLDGGLGADTLIGGPGDFDTVDFSARTSSVTVALLGSAGSGQGGENDTIGADVEDAIGGAGADSFVGNTSDNIFDGGLGGDTFDGGRGFDLVDYSTRAKPVIVSLDGRRNDGVAGERDNVATGVEAVAGGRGKDTLRGDGYANALDGGPGADAIYGAAGADVLLGEGGRDKLVGGRGRDTISGGRGNDVIRSRDRVVDTVVCGAGRDAVLADALELVSKDCERVDRGKCVVPKVVGKPLVSAVNAIAVAGCRVGKITKVKSSKTKNTVVGQTPHPGKRLKFGSKVSLRVSRGR